MGNPCFHCMIAYANRSYENVKCDDGGDSDDLYDDGDDFGGGHDGNDDYGDGNNGVMTVMLKY